MATPSDNDNPFIFDDLTSEPRLPAASHKSKPIVGTTTPDATISFLERLEQKAVGIKPAPKAAAAPVHKDRVEVPPATVSNPAFAEAAIEAARKDLELWIRVTKRWAEQEFNHSAPLPPAQVTRLQDRFIEAYLARQPEEHTQVRNSPKSSKSTTSLSSELKKAAVDAANNTINHWENVAKIWVQVEFNDCIELADPQANSLRKALEDGYIQKNQPKKTATR